MGVFKRKQKSSENYGVSLSCGYKTMEECPYQDESDCRFEKTNCALKRDKNARKRRRKHLSRIVWMVVGASTALVVLFGLRASLDICDYWRELSSALIGCAFSILAAAIMAIIIDIPSWMKDYEEHFARILSSNSYLKTLDEKSLVQLRQDITTQIHKTTTPKMAEGLVRMDESICAYFKKPYYERYMQSVRCHITDDHNTIEKTYDVEYKLINPNVGYQEAEELVRIVNLVQKTNDEKGITGFKLSYRIDGGEEHGLSEEYGLATEPLDEKIEFYDTKIYLAYMPKVPIKRRFGFGIRFKEDLLVKYSYTIRIDARDRCFTKRLQHPAELFILNYSCDNEDINIQGQLIGTDMKQSNVSIHYHDENSISLVSYDWLLPDNGAVVVMLDKKNA